MKKKIVSISFLFAGERLRIGSDANGKFPLPRIRKKRNYNESLSYMHPHTAKDFVEHKKVRDGDPVLTMSDGSKMRVYLNGDPSGPVVEALSMIENHDNACSLRKRVLENAKKKVKINGKKSNKVRSKSNSNSAPLFKGYSPDPLSDYGFDIYGFDGDTD